MATEPLEAPRAAPVTENGSARRTRSSENSSDTPIRTRGKLALLQTHFAALAVLVLVVIVALASWTAAAVIAAIYLLLSVAYYRMRPAKVR